MNDHRMALRRPGNVERTLDREKFTFVIEDMHLVSVGEPTADLVHDDGVVLPAVPQSFDDLHKLSRDGIALGMRRMTFVAEICRGLGKGSGHDIPAGASPADMVDRCKRAREIVGLAVGCRCGSGKTDMGCARGKRREKGKRLETDHDRRMRVRPRVERVGEKEQVELATLGGLRDLQQEWKVFGAGLRLRKPPAGDMMSGTHDVDAEMHLLGCLNHRDHLA